MSADNEHRSNEHIIEFGDYSDSEDEESEDEQFILDVSFWQSRGCNEAVSQSMVHFQYNLVLQTALLDLLKEYSEGVSMQRQSFIVCIENLGQTMKQKMKMNPSYQ